MHCISRRTQGVCRMRCLPRQYKMWVSHYDSRLSMASATLRVGFWGSLKPDNGTRSERKRRSTCYLLIRGPRKMFTNAEGTLHLSPFVFITCQYQTENLIKGWMQSSVPQAKFAFSRPGLLTFNCLLYTSPSPRDCDRSRMPSSA